MRSARLFVISLTAFLIAACSSGVPRATLDGPTTVITVAAAAYGVSTLGVPFVDGVPVVEDVEVSITLDGAVLSFTFEDGVFSHDPDGLVDIIAFPFMGSVSVALPAGNEYGFVATGTDGDGVWVVYGLTDATVDVSTSSVRLELWTLIDMATLDTATEVTAVVPGERIDLFLSVFAPGGYSVPIADYSVVYEIGTDGSFVAESKLGARATAADPPVDDMFTVTATVSGWRNVDGVATPFQSVVGTYEMAFAISAGFGFDVSAPTVTIDDVTTATVGSAVVLSGTALDDVGVDRVHVFEGPQLVGSSDQDEQDVDGVAAISLAEDVWSMSWTPSNVGSHTFTVVAVDAAGNEGRSTRTIEVVEPTTLTFVDGLEGAPATLTAGEPVILTGAAYSGWSARDAWFYYFDALGNGFDLSKAGLEVVDGMWVLQWTAPAVGTYELWYETSDSAHVRASFSLTVQ